MKNIKSSHLVLTTLAVLVVAGILMYHTRSTRPLVQESEPDTQATSSVPTPTDKVVTEKTGVYDISITYPFYSIPSIDTEIQSVITASEKDFKDFASDPASVSPAAEQNTLSISYGTKVGNSITTVVFTGSEYTGGAHPIPFYYTVHFDGSGKIITLDKLFKVPGPTYFAKFSQIVTPQLKQQFGDAFFPDGATSNPENWNLWYIENGNLVFMFSPYQVAPYAAGTPEVKIPLTDLSDILE